MLCNLKNVSVLLNTLYTYHHNFVYAYLSFAFINAFKSILSAYISSHLMFRKFFLSTMVGTITSAIVGIVMALNGFGCWALVGQQMTNAVVGTISLYLTTRVKFVFKFSPSKAKGLFGYGWKILVASGISVAYDEINPLIIGIKFSVADLAFYSKGKSFPGLINSSLSDTLSSVLFSVMAKVQREPTIFIATSSLSYASLTRISK